MTEPSPLILLVEDDEMNLELAEYLLEEGGLRVATARDAASARAWAARERADLVLLDVNLPDGHGLRLARELAALEGWGGVPFVALTAMAMAGDRERILAEGVSGYISKPIDPARFVDTVRAYLGPGGAR